MPDKTPQPPGSERHRDEEREGGPRYGGGAWQVADERGDKRFGHARNDDAEASELPPGEPKDADAAANSDSVGAELASDEADTGIESSAQHIGMHHDDKLPKDDAQ